MNEKLCRVCGCKLAIEQHRDVTCTLGNVAWHLIALFATWVRDGLVRLEYCGGIMLVVPR